MKLFSTVLRRKRGVLLFAAALLLPLLFVILVSIDTFSKRQKTTRSLLESNLWLSGRSALDHFENQFNLIEKKWLNPEYFSGLLKNDSIDGPGAIAELFLIDQDFQIIYPKTGEDKSLQLLDSQGNWEPGYRKSMGIAETEELTNRNFSNAINYYQASLRLAKTTQQEALAIGGTARACVADHQYRQAIRYYQLLANQYSSSENLSGHPYGLSAPLQLYTIGLLTGSEVISRDSMLMTFRMLKDGHWHISSSIYSFFKEEYQAILKTGKETDDSRFERKLIFNRFLESTVIPSIKERFGFSDFNKSAATRRLYAQSYSARYLASFKVMPVGDTNRLYFAGIRWNLDSVATRMVPTLLAGLSKETGLEFRLVDGNNNNVVTGEKEPVPEKSLSLSFSNIPFPWTLIAIQPGFKDLESDARTQLIIYGLLLVLIIILMFFGVFVLLRDINRERDTMLLQTEFVHNVSHELKTPLSLIRLYGETLLLKETLPKADRQEGLQIITKESERLSHMINNILDFSKIEMGRKEFDLKPGNLAAVISDTINSYRYHLEKKGFETEVEIDPDIPRLLFDKNAVEGILINLFSNAIKFSDDNKRLRVRLKKSPDTVILAVADQGIGIAPEELPNIFKRFYRAKNNSGFEARGSGLGLTLVKHAVDAHGWLIEVDSTPGKGTTFTISIPLHSNPKDLP